MMSTGSAWVPQQSGSAAVPRLQRPASPSSPVAYAPQPPYGVSNHTRQSGNQSSRPLPPPVIRAQSNDSEPANAVKPAPLRLPSPEELGLTASKPVFDWTAAHRRLEQLGATCFHIERLASGDYRVTAMFTTGSADRTRRIDAEAASAEQAAQMLLEKADALETR
ncbi:MAG: hypothetical protein KatS3mg105_2802 [Gemmatales bacterium]|nr:MAG: hypothetical protein KatS3mg105_2802 [Gemmatales bacterium]